MLKKTILSVALTFTMFAGAPASATVTVNPDHQDEKVGTQGGQAEVTGDWADSKEVNTVQESELTRKAIQAEKARNAAENDEFGGAITLIAMSIVVSALLVLSILFMLFGKVSSWLQTRRKHKAHGVTPETSEAHHDEPDMGEAIAAISMALAEHTGQGHDIEDTILTIRRMKKSYSPWNSKIYNIRVTPGHTHTSADRRKL